MTNQPAIVEKIQKLLAKANDPSTTEAEASAFAAKVNSLLLQHNLSMSAIPDQDTTSATTDPINHKGATSSGQSPWIRSVWHQVALLNLCGYFFRTASHKTFHTVVGTDINVLATEVMAEYLTATVKTLSAKAKKENGGDNRFQEAFKKGCAQRIAYRLQELRQEQEQAAKPTPADADPDAPTSGNIPALYQNHQVATNDYIAEHFGKLKASKSRTRHSDAAGYAAGAAAGQNVGLHTQIS